MKTPIYVPSRGRCKTSKTIAAATDQAVKLHIVVEPQEYENYRLEWFDHEVICLPADNQGITYVRNFIKEHAEKNSLQQYWQLDDDVQQLYARSGTKMNKAGFEVLTEAEKQFLAGGYALGGLEYQQFAWSATKPVVENSFCDVCVWVDNTRTYGLRYRAYVEGKEDRDFAMQVIKKGHATARTTLYGFAAPANGSNAGGLKEIFYDAGKETRCVDRMVELWGERVCTPIIKPNGRRDVKINWSEINSTQISLF